MPNIVTTGLGMLMGEYSDWRQRRQQKKLQDMQIAGQKEMGLFNQELAIDTWNKTNFEAQRKHMEKAGLNVGLMYSGTGAGGTTSQPGNVSGTSAPVGGNELGMAIQLELLKAQKENIQANTEKTKVDTAKTAGVDTEAVKTGIDQMKQQTTNLKLQNEIDQFGKKLAEIETNVANQSQEALIEQNNQEAKLLKKQVELMEGTNAELIKQAKLATIEANWRIATAKQGIKLSNEQINKMANDTFGIWEELRLKGRQLDQNDIDLMLKKWQTEYNIGTDAGIGGWMRGAEFWGHLIPF